MAQAERAVQAPDRAVENELRNLRSAVWRMVAEVDECHCVTTEGGDRFMLTDTEAAAVRRALEANGDRAEGHD